MTENDATESYLKWMNDNEIVKFTESRFITHSIESLKDFINSVSNSSNYLFAIIDKETGQHIGNIKIGNIHSRYLFADIGLIIGERAFWGKGIATEAIKQCVDFAFNTLNLHRLYAGIYANNIGSIKAFEKAGFIKEGCERAKYLINNEWIDSYLYGIINENY